MRQLRGERRTVDEAVEELRTMLMQSVAERTRLAGVLLIWSHVYASHNPHKSRNQTTNVRMLGQP